MHKLDRAVVTKPSCLDDYDWNTQKWGDLLEEDKKIIRLTLQSLQGPQSIDESSDDGQMLIIGLRCAYCESQVYGGHIEHFRRKNPNHFPHLTFEWTNLFIACDSTEHCGHYKDRRLAPPYNPDKLIKPDDYDPDDYLHFHSSGEVRVRNCNGMTESDSQRAQETIRVFNLNCPRLKGSRRKALQQYRQKGFLEALMHFDESDWQSFIGEEIEATKWDPFWTTIRHLLERLPA